MAVAPARKASEPAKGNRQFKNTPLNDGEKQRLHALAIRFQDIIHDKNLAIKDVSKKLRVKLEDVDLIRAGLLRLEAIPPDRDNEFFDWVMKGTNRE